MSVSTIKVNGVEMPLEAATRESNLLKILFEDHDEGDDGTIMLPNVTPLALQVFASMVSHPSLPSNPNCAASHLDLPESVKELDECLCGADFLDSSRLIDILLDRASLLHDTNAIEPYPYYPKVSWYKVSPEQYVVFLDALGLPDIPIEHGQMNTMAGIYTYFPSIQKLKTLQLAMRRYWMKPIEFNRHGYFRGGFQDKSYYTSNGWKVQTKDKIITAQGCGRHFQRSWTLTLTHSFESIHFSPSGMYGCVMVRHTSGVVGVTVTHVIFNMKNGSLKHTPMFADMEDTYFINDQYQLNLDGDSVMFLDMKDGNPTSFISGSIGRPCWDPIVTPNYLFVYVHYCARNNEEHKSVCGVKLDTLDVNKKPFESDYPSSILPLKGKDEVLIEFKDNTTKVLDLVTMVFRDVKKEDETYIPNIVNL